MDILTGLDHGTEYSETKLQLILGAWVMATLFESGKSKVSLEDGDIDEDDYTKQSIYSLLYAIYSSLGEIRTETGKLYELTFNTWGYSWPTAWDEPKWRDDPQRFGMNAYAGLFEFDPVKQYIDDRDGEVHVVEMGCGTGAGAHHICKNVLSKCTYEAVDMQQAAIQTCLRKFVPELGTRLKATRADATRLNIDDGVADFVAVCETHVTEHAGECGDEDERFFRTVHRLLKPGGFLVWGNAIPDSTWEPCFEFLSSIGMKKRVVRDVTEQAVAARDEDAQRVHAFVDQAINRFVGFRIPFIGRKRRSEAELAMKNFYRNPGTNLYRNMTDGTDTYKVALFEKTA